MSQLASIYGERWSHSGWHRPGAVVSLVGSRSWRDGHRDNRRV